MKSALILIFTLLLTLTSCSSAPYDKMTDEMYTQDVNTYAPTTNGSFGYMTGASSDMAVDAEMEYVKEDYTYSTSTSVEEAGSAITGRKLIREATLNMETKEYDTLLATLEQKIAEAGGYIQSARSQGNPEYSNRWMQYVLRIPEQNYETFLDNINTLGTVTSHSENVTDITLSYTDTESRIKALETEYDTLISILEKCDSLTDVITVQSRITEVTYQLENYKSTLRTYDNQVSYCTVNLYVDEVQKITESQKNLSVGERMKRDILDGWKDFADDALDFFVWLAAALPALIVWAIVIIVIVVLIRRSIRKRRMKKNAVYYTPAPTQPAAAVNEPTEIKK